MMVAILQGYRSLELCSETVLLMSKAAATDFLAASYAVAISIEGRQTEAGSDAFVDAPVHSVHPFGKESGSSQ
jgi:hypothetical protein